MQATPILFGLPSTRRHRRAAQQPVVQRGVTLIELMVTVAVLGVLMAIAAPSFSPIAESYRVRQVTEELQATLYFARSEAIKSNGHISVLPNSGNWAQGWQVKHTGKNEVLRQTDAPSKVTITLVGDKGGVDIDRWGMLMHKDTDAAAALKFTITTTGDSGRSRTLCSQAGGRLYQGC